MKLLYDPLDPQYHDAAEAGAERDRTFQICTDCRLCVKYCFSFKSRFQLVDDLHEDRVDELTGAEHERIVDECFQCKLCHTNCSYTPDQGQEWVIDSPGLMTRSLIIQHDEGKVGAKLLARTDLQGLVATTLSPIVNKVTTTGALRRLMERTTGISKDRLLPSFAKVRFTRWFRDHAAKRAGKTASRATVALFPTCLVDYQNPDIGKATVGVLEHNGVECGLPEGQVCCGMPWLDAGDQKKFRQHAEKNVAVLAPAVRAGKDVVVPQPTCSRSRPSTRRSSVPPTHGWWPSTPSTRPSTSWPVTPRSRSTSTSPAGPTNRSCGSRRATTRRSTWAHGAWR